MTGTHPGGVDPRSHAIAGDVRPIVAPRGRGLPAWALAATGGVAAILLFAVLEARRQSAITPSVAVRAADSDDLPPAAPPALYIPPHVPLAPPLLRAELPREPVPAPEPRATPPMPPPVQQPQVVYMPQPVPPAVPVEPARARGSADPVLVIDTTVGPATSAAPPSGPAIPGAANAPAIAARARATVLRNGPTTVPQGTIIPAVLETALDSTRPGPARAMVTRDVRGADAARVIIPRGSRLTGEYVANAALGQKRAMVMWTRLVRPDGVAIAIGSPAVDPLGRAGIKARVNSHFFERFGSAILQSVLSIGTSVAASQLGDGPVIVALPGTLQSGIAPGAGFGGSTNVTPTLRVRQGTAIAVLVARDLDFTGVEARR